jgi:formate hydrogenlyase transcriptional activator
VAAPPPGPGAGAADPSEGLLPLHRLLTAAAPWPEALTLLRRLAGADRASLVLLPPGQPPSGFALPASGPRAGEPAALPPELCAATAAVLDQPQSLPFPEDRLLAQQGYPCRTYLPLLCRGRAVGVLGLAWKEPGPAAPAWLEQAAAVLALALDGAHSREQLGELRARLEREGGYLREEIKGERDLRLLTGDSPAMKAVRQGIGQVARTDSTVLIQGETGTGKELVARAIHQLSGRRDRLLVSVNCAALAASVITSELFGHEAGAFTGALKRRPGRFELAQRGTIFLDEIGEVPPETQVLLLRVLQERVIERVGGSEPLAIDVRVIAATNQDLHAAVGQGRFRADLYYRLNVFPIHVPPLRQRREDVPSLAGHFVQHLGRRLHRQVAGIDPDSLALLCRYDWPGNVRELENVIERAMIVSSGGPLVIDPSWFPAASPTAATGPSTLAEVERQAIRAALERCGGRIYGPMGAAAALGLKPTTLYGKMRKLHISRQADPTPAPTK